MATYAGSAIAQNVGKMDRFDDWKPVARNTNWLLIAGALDPPRSIEISKRRNRDGISNRSGSFLYGVTQDLGYMQAVIAGKPGRNLHSILMNMKNLTKEEVKTEIKDLFEACKKSNQAPILYYSGHGQTGTGDWCFSDGTLSILEIEALVIGSNYPLIISDACFSGNWADHCAYEAKDGYHCLAACPAFSTANDLGKGGELTLWMCGKLGGWLGQGRPRTEPMYSKGNLNDFPVPDEYNLIDYTGFLSSMMKNTKRVLISQSVCNGTFSGIFAPHDQFNPCPVTGWREKSTHEGFMQYVKELKSANKNIYSLACDDQFGFGVFATQNFGTEQDVTWTRDRDMSDIQKWLDAGYHITACGARHSTFYCVLTKGAIGFSGKGQTYFTRESWQGIDEEINKKFKEGKRITSICYSTGLKQYLVVMTESTAGQQLRWDTGNNKEDFKWMDEREDEGLHPTIVFKDPTDKKVLVVSTADENRTKAWIFRSNYPLKK